MMWKKIDNELYKYFKRYKGNQEYLLDNIELLFSSHIDLNKKVSSNKLKRALQKVKFPKNSQLDYFKRDMMKRARITQKEYITGMLYILYWEQNQDALPLFNEISRISYENTLDSLTDDLKHKVKGLSFYQLMIMTLPTHLGWEWQEYITNDVIYSSNEMIKQYQINLQQGRQSAYKTILDRQQRRHLNINDSNGKKTHSGAVEVMSSFIANQMIYNIALDIGIKQVKFIGISDDRQTQMCKSLNGQIFNVNEINKFTRYFDSTKGYEYIEVDGLVLGLNLPPITDNFHYCRSTIQFLN